MLPRGALDLLSVYNDDTEEDDLVVPGPRVSTKRLHEDDDDDDEYGHKNKHLTRFPLPQVFSASLPNSSHIDHPNQHGGRKRTFPHQRGNWATYVYIPYEKNIAIEELIIKIRDLIKNVVLQEVDHYHISLTKTVILRHHWIEPFMKTIRNNILSQRKFIIMFNSLKIYCNDERTRTFIGIQIKTGFDALKKLVNVLDGCLNEFKLAPFYKDPSFHMSILWCLGDKEKELKVLINDINELLGEVMIDHMDEKWHIMVNELQCKTGNKLYSFSLT